MNREFIVNHIKGGLAGAFIGDAMGAATETMTPEGIHRQFGGVVEKFYVPPAGAFAYGNKAGELTDDSSQMLEMVHAIVEDKGKLTPETVVKYLLHWATNEDWYNRFAGPTTKKAITLLREGASPYETGGYKPGSVLSNGAAMKVSPMGLAHPGDVDSAIRDAITMCIPTHNTDVAYAGAAAVAAAIAAAMIPGTGQLEVVDAALYGAREGYRIGKEKAQVVAHPSMVERIRLAVEIGVSETDFNRACLRLLDVIGCGLPIIEAAPVSIGLFVAARGDPNKTITGAVNIGDDSDTVATIAGAIAGAYAGIDRVNPEWVHTIETVNHLSLDEIANQLADLSQ